MLILILFFFGAILSWFLQKNNLNLKSIDKVIEVLLITLLFSLGLSLGGNHLFFDNIDKIGSSSLVLAIFSILGSILFGNIIFPKLVKKYEKD